MAHTFAGQTEIPSVEAIEKHVRNTAGRQINLPAAKALIERRGVWAHCLKK